MQAWWSRTLSKGNFNTGGFLHIFRDFKEDIFCRRCASGYLSEWSKKHCINKIYSRENTVNGVLFSAASGMHAYSFTKKESTTDAFPWKLRSFTEHYFYRTLPVDCFWFPVACWTSLLFYQEYISSVLASCLGLSKIPICMQSKVYALNIFKEKQKKPEPRVISRGWDWRN